MNARDTAIEKLRRWFGEASPAQECPTWADTAAVVDAIIDAARAPESDHTRGLVDLGHKREVVGVDFAAGPDRTVEGTLGPDGIVDWSEKREKTP